MINNNMMNLSGLNLTNLHSRVLKHLLSFLSLINVNSQMYSPPISQQMNLRLSINHQLLDQLYK